ncbi:uncharacterized protein LOC124660409 [Lolium rigidum]|uniref:uncharacterized protein LOC124660409 n=1 Tax=Lolium rigidum TaxID=89674 RepID=UPI001F5DA322|nr:uncharacterized protein LOC124660409 [Lolium rigidum]XP_047054175.1 uncharacterized protein LOC124660409 [Lolium rigidum]
MEEGARMAPNPRRRRRRRSPPLYPQIQAIEDGGRMARRSSPRLHPQIHASEDGAGLTRTSPVESASLPDDDDMLREILRRLPPQPSSLPRASAVCKRWRGLVTDPKFHRQFRAHHGKPPLLGLFELSNEGIVFKPILDPPDCIPSQRFHLGRYSQRCHYILLDSRHGLVLVKNSNQNQVVVCDPITGHHRCLAVPSELRMGKLGGAVLCAAGDHGHVHVDCHPNPFKVVLVSTATSANQPLACVYSSETLIWSNLISAEAPRQFFNAGVPPTLIGSALYWLSVSDLMLKFDLDEHILAAISVPPVTDGTYYRNRRIIQAEDGAIGFAILSYPSFQMWQRNVNGHGVVTWLPSKTIDIHTFLGLPSQIGLVSARLLGYDEDTDEIFVYVRPNVYGVQLKLMQSRKLNETTTVSPYYLFKSFYTPAIYEGDEADMLHHP